MHANNYESISRLKEVFFVSSRWHSKCTSLRFWGEVLDPPFEMGMVWSTSKLLKLSRSILPRSSLNCELLHIGHTPFCFRLSLPFIPVILPRDLKSALVKNSITFWMSSWWPCIWSRSFGIANGPGTVSTTVVGSTKTLSFPVFNSLYREVLFTTSDPYPWSLRSTPSA